ncbi:3-keto-disaccharide hydrolase [Chondrinema litorale]|uniref:3-keto-disaccharide hydrolase n=1 Tax=Chondrinema litorale TaxID=2994555 RepID=UPI002542DA41|nr:DUF1080 domain-containing protein [Chondrinema litorale]UZR97267.1 DUF1080 domain-containing protein [Chondrinema litorale]
MKQVRSGVLILTALLFFGCKEDTPKSKKPEATFPMKTIVLDDLSTFKDPGQNWQVTGNVYANRNQEQSLEPESGNGILVNLPNESQHENLFTNFEHTDLDIELDVMMPKNSNSGIYLMSRYEVQLFDSWGVDQPQHSDIGGIYERWDDSKPEGENGFEGIAPKINAAKAPGLWQHLNIVFQAPRFDSNGKKIKNAVFKEVYLNGTLIQKDAEVSGPTRAAAFQNEVASAPLMIQGDHGPVAFRNIKYKSYNGHQVSLQNITLKQYASTGDTLGDFLSQQPTQNIQTDTISYTQASEGEKYLLYYEGEMTLPDDASYIFSMRMHGGGFLIVGEDTLLNAVGDHDFAEMFYMKKSLKAGTYPFKFVYNKFDDWWRRGMALYVESENTAKQTLNAPSSIFIVKPDSPIIIPAEKVVTQRSFIMHKDIKRTHVISVGTPYHIHYSYDMSTGTFLQAWQGDFLNVSDMWYQRGEPQLAETLGPKTEFYAGPAVAKLESENTLWPDTIWLDKPYRHLGYTLDNEGYPEFKMNIGETLMTDKILPDSDSHKFTRTIKIEHADAKTYVKLAEGKEIEKLPDGTYAINDKEYYLAMSEPDKELLVRKVGGKQELLYKVEGESSDIIYETIW